jgi:hydrogenase maturation protein HypF
MQLGLQGLFEDLLADIEGAVPVGEIAYRFHLTAAHMIRAMCAQIAMETGLDTVALSGGCFQNRLLFGLVVPLIRDAGLSLLVHRQVPCNDGGIALGQAVVAGRLRGARSLQK